MRARNRGKSRGIKMKRNENKCHQHMMDTIALGSGGGVKRGCFLVILNLKHQDGTRDEESGTFYGLVTKNETLIKQGL